MGKIRFLALWMTLLLAPAAPLHAQALDAASADALAQTLRMLADPAGRSLIIAGDPRAAEIDRQVQGMTGSSELVQEVYRLAAEVFADLARSAGGDAGRISEALERAKSDPAAFAAMLSPQTLERLRELSVRLSDAKR